MGTPEPLTLAQAVAGHLRQQRHEITSQWLHRLLGWRDPDRYPTLPVKHLMDGMPSVVEAIADRIEHPESGFGPVEHWLREIIDLQRARDTPLQEVLADVELLGVVLFEACREVVDRTPTTAAADALDLAQRLSASLSTFTTMTAGTYEKSQRAEVRELRGRVEEFVRTLSHELKNPLGAAELAAQMLMDEEIASKPGERERYREMIVRNLKRGRVLVDEMRDRALPDLAGPAQEEWTTLATVLDDVLLEVTPSAQEEGVAIRLQDIPDDLEVLEAETKLILMNLVWNAVRYSDPAKPERWARIGAVGGDVSNVWFIRVEDNGLGIPRGAQDRIFDRFYRAHPWVENGTGLGLSIARETAEEMGGGLWFTSEPGSGSTFTVAVRARTGKTLDEHAQNGADADAKPRAAAVRR